MGKLDDPTRLMTVEEFMRYTPPNIPAVVDHGILFSGTNMIIFGEPKTYKSTLMYELALSLATGNHWVGFGTKKCIVFYVQAEMPLAVQRLRLDKSWIGHTFADLGIYMKFDRAMKLDTMYGQNKLAHDLKHIRSVHPKEELVVILDPLFELMMGRISDEYEMRKFTSAVNALQQEHQFTTIIVHHARKTHLDDNNKKVKQGAQEMLGSVILDAWLDTCGETIVHDFENDPTAVELKFLRTRHGMPVSSVHMRINVETFRPVLDYNKIMGVDALSINDLS
uniref:Putative ATPase domain containing protein n=1 Tax=viral metagenome TaxID=1070528 RepID=A0A6M3K5J0_9ZZZZ